MNICSEDLLSHQIFFKAMSHRTFVIWKNIMPFVFGEVKMCDFGYGENATELQFSERQQQLANSVIKFLFLKILFIFT